MKNVPPPGRRSCGIVLSRKLYALAIPGFHPRIWCRLFFRYRGRPDDLAGQVEWFAEYAQELNVLNHPYPFANPYTRACFFQRAILPESFVGGSFLSSLSWSREITGRLLSPRELFSIIQYSRPLGILHSRIPNPHTQPPKNTSSPHPLSLAPYRKNGE